MAETNDLVEIVDENDKTIGQEVLKIVHEKKLLHRGANILIFRDDSFKELLLQKRSMNMLMGGKLCLCGGHLIAGQTYLEAAKAEFIEEMHTSKIVDEKIVFEELFKVKKIADDDHEIMTIFRIVSNGPFNPNPQEVEDYEYYNINELFEKINSNPELFTETTIFLLKEYKKRFL